MLNMNLQFFAHKKGVGSTKNGRDSESKRRSIRKSRKYSVQAARNEDPSRHQCGERRRRHVVCTCRWCS